jgi:hypothetical protein
MPGLRMDEHFTKLLEDVLHKTATQDKSDHTDDDGQERHPGASLVS